MLHIPIALRAVLKPLGPVLCSLQDSDTPASQLAVPRVMGAGAGSQGGRTAAEVDRTADHVGRTPSTG